MADTYEKDLAQKSSLTTSDFIRVVGSDNVSYKQLVSDVAMALSNALPLTGEVVTSLRAWAETVNGKGITSTNNATTDTPSSAPRKYGVAWTNNYNHGSTKWLNLFWTPTQSDEIYYCHKTNATAWTAWVKLPTRAEVDALNSKWRVVSSGSMKSINESGVYYVTNAVADKPVSTGGLFILMLGSTTTGTGFYVANTSTQQIYWVTIANSVWTYHAIS